MSKILKIFFGILKNFLLAAVFAGTFLFEIGSGTNPLIAFLAGLAALATGLFLMFFLAPFFSSFTAFLWFVLSLISLFLLVIISYSQWDPALSWDKQITGFYLTAALAASTVFFYLYYAFIVFMAFVSTIIYAFKKSILYAIMDKTNKRSKTNK